MSETKLAKARIKRDVATAQLTRITAFVNKFSDIQSIELPTIDVRLDALQKSYDSFMVYQNLIEELDENELGKSDRAEFEEEYFELKARLLTIKDKLNPVPKRDDDKSTTISSIKLPKISLPCFSGNFTEWIPFYSTFCSLVDTNKQLDALSKFHYLRTSLSGQALSSIQSIEINSRNYNVALKLLKDRYDNSKLIAQEHLKGLFNLPSLEKGEVNSIRLRELIDSTKNHLEALSSLGRSTNHWDDLIVHLVLSKLDSVHRNKWEDECHTDRLATLDEVFKFLDRRCQILDATNQASSSKPVNSIIKPSIIPFKQRVKSTSLMSNEPFKCQFCSQLKHNIYRCRRFIALPPNERILAVKRLKLCVNCLKNTHATDQCPQSSCRECGSKHNTLLHQFTTSISATPASTSSSSSTPVDSDSKSSDMQHLSMCSKSSCLVAEDSPAYHSHKSLVLLATAVINVLDQFGAPVPCRAILDSGSQSNFISQQFLSKLRLPCMQINHSINGIANSSISSKRSANLTIHSRVSEFNTQISAIVLPQITIHQPSGFINIKDWKIPNHVNLADPNFFQPQPIDVLIGAELHFNLLRNQSIDLGSNLPQLYNTHFGWILAGRLSSNITDHSNSTTLLSLDQIVQRFWEIENHSTISIPMTFEQAQCEKMFSSSVKRNSSGRFIVQLPFRINPERLGNSRDVAFKRFMHLEKKLKGDSDLRQEYNNFMAEYISMGHMERIDTLPSNHYFLPHHFVLKPESTSTKLRVVFDGSAKTSTQLSLNHILMNGPTVQPDLFSIIVKFRNHPFVFTGDINKMYRQVLVDTEDRKFQCIFWRNDENAELFMYQLNTVTYGTSAAPFLATRCLNQLAIDEEVDFPHASTILLQDFYVDDVMSGANTISEAKSRLMQLITLLDRGGFTLRKFCANHREILSEIPSEYHENQMRVHDKDVVKTLGLIWEPSEDCFHYNISPDSYAKIQRITKRQIASDLAHIFDPLGLIGPVVILAKIFLQQIWKIKLNWDADVPQEYHITWLNFRSQLQVLNQIRIPRLVRSANTVVTTEIHAFSDSSEKAYGACCYLRCVDSTGIITSYLICAKSRVAPLKNVTLPRLELCAALLMTELVQKIQSIYDLPSSHIAYYTDSTIVLAWISKPSYCWHTFVANRVSKIQTITTITQWRHINTHHNPADLISRGMYPIDLLKSELWYNGPCFLSTPAASWPTDIVQSVSQDIISSEVPECRAAVVSLSATCPSTYFIDLINHQNSYMRLVSIVAYCYRFTINASVKQSSIFGPLQPNEIESALIGLIRCVQRDAFPTELQSLAHHNCIQQKSRLRNLCPFLDSRGLIRVGGRLEHSRLPYDAKHQLLLPKNNTLTILIMQYIHKKHLHASPQSLLSFTRQRFWPIDGLTMAKRVVNRCMHCFHIKPKTMQQIMGNLPEHRIIPGRPFLTTGVDFCGPIKIHFRIRGKGPVKAYIAVFICFTTKAVHLELVSELTTEAFIASLKRFTGRRGLCRTIYCDNATNFVGARSELNELRELFLSQKHQDKIVQWCVQDNIQWKHIPPRSPHFGGLWEAAVKLAKTYLVRSVAEAKLTYEEMNTYVIQIEAILNSRPITPLSSDPNDVAALTPGHFLIGTPLNAIIEPDVKDDDCNSAVRFRILRQLHQHFWKRWSMEYLHQLQTRQKWFNKNEGIREGSLVLLKEENLPPLKWMTGRIVKLYPGQDGRTRVADVKTSTGVYKRSIVKLCLLPLDDNTDQPTTE